MKKPPGSENSAIIVEKVSPLSCFGSDAAVPNRFVTSETSASTAGEIAGVINVGPVGSELSKCHNSSPAAVPNTIDATIQALCFMNYCRQHKQTPKATPQKK